MANSMDFRRKAVAYKQKGHTFEELKEAFGIPPQTFCERKERLDSGYYQAKPRQALKRKTDKGRLGQAVKDKPGIFLHEPAKMFGCSPQAAHAVLKKLGITRKKRCVCSEAPECGRAVRRPQSVRGAHK